MPGQEPTAKKGGLYFGISMSSILNLNQLSAYGLSAQALQKYLTKTSSAPFAAFPQAYHFTTKKTTTWGKKHTNNYDDTGFPNAWPFLGAPSPGAGLPAIPGSTLDWTASQGPGAVKNINDFLDKDAETLKYFWQWT